GGAASMALDELGLADQRLVREIGKVLPNMDKMREATDLSAKAFEENTALTEEAEKRYETFTSQLQLFLNELDIMAAELGKQVIPALKAMFEQVIPIIRAVAEWIRMNPELGAQLLALAGALTVCGPLLKGMSSLLCMLTNQ